MNREKMNMAQLHCMSTLVDMKQARCKFQAQAELTATANSDIAQGQVSEGIYRARNFQTQSRSKINSTLVDLTHHNFGKLYKPNPLMPGEHFLWGILKKKPCCKR